MIATENGRRLPRGVAEETIMAALNTARQDGVSDLGFAELQAQTGLAIATLYDALGRLANLGKIESSKTTNEETGRPEVRISLPKS